ncbi:MAG: molecular chaperone, partial [bacterium]
MMQSAATHKSDDCSADMINDEQFVDDRTRAALYGILGRTYSHELTLEFAKELRQVGFFEILAGMDSSFTVEDDLNSLDFDSLAVEFARLFVGPGLRASPYASVYREDDQRGGQLWGETTGEVKRFMAHYGLKVNKPGTIPDHISVLFEFMEKLLRAKIEAFRQGDEEACRQADRIQRQFFANYIEPWIERFLQRVLGAKPLPFYSALAKFTQQFIIQEK